MYATMLLFPGLEMRRTDGAPAKALKPILAAGETADRSDPFVSLPNE